MRTRARTKSTRSATYSTRSAYKGQRSNDGIQNHVKDKEETEEAHAQKTYIQSCGGKSAGRMSLIELGSIAFGGTPAIVAFLQSKNVLARQKQCRCGTMMVLQDRTDISDGCRWRCPDCKAAVSIRKGSFFEKSKITLQRWLLLMHWWSRQYSVKDAAEEVGVSEPTAIQVYSWLRDVCSHRLCTVDAPIKLGGQGVIVAIDESLFSHKPKVVKSMHCI